MTTDTKTFGNWTFDEKALTLCYKEHQYCVDLRECKTSAELLDWICHISESTWASQDDVGAFVRAVNVLIQPQSTLCCEGKDQGPIEVEKVIRNLGKIREVTDAALNAPKGMLQ